MRVHPVAVLWLHEGDQLVEDEELQLELGAVNKRLVTKALLAPKFQVFLGQLSLAELVD
jgi:hypothetical protein